MPLCSVIAYTFPSTAWSYVLYILQLDKMVWLRNEVAALIAVFICYKVVTWTRKVTLTPASQFRQKGEKVEGNKVPPCLWALAAFSPFCGSRTGGEELQWGETTTPQAVSWAEWRAYWMETKINTSLERLLSQTLFCRRHQKTINMSATQRLLQESLPSGEKIGCRI